MDQPPDPNPYESPRCSGYQPPAKSVSKTQDMIALVCWGLAINLIVQVIAFGVALATGYLKVFE
jgi:hypothetical protein